MIAVLVEAIGEALNWSRLEVLQANQSFFDIDVYKSFNMSQGMKLYRYRSL